ncbi:Potassium voltage-gated channel Shal [Paramuricea clavata]|uniref:Potassium voltage-gated channel Shal, partial n=1 Tax=Paramuricea clavata TaxID=317549 RepID=A0A6S7ILI4_PARCT|nr:Potassium voltage-gated channel Shal [Paramuricea clavata]
MNGMKTKAVALASNAYIIINVSGRRFKTDEKILERYPETLLGGKRRYYYFDCKREEYFFDRDPDIFPHILNFYRSGNLHYPPNECAELFESELRFFGIFTEDISLCCAENYELLKNKTDKYREAKSKQKIMAAARARRLKHINGYKEKLWFIFEQPGLSTPGLVVWGVTILFILTTVVSLILETVPKEDGTWGSEHREDFNYSETICVVFFTIEYIIKLYSSPNRWTFVKQFSNIIDLLSILPFYFGIILGDRGNSRFFVILRVLRVTRVLKISKFSAEKMEQHGNLLKQNQGELTPLLVCFITVLVIFSTVIYYSEKNEDRFPNIPACFWYTIVTMTSLG